MNLKKSQYNICILKETLLNSRVLFCLLLFECDGFKDEFTKLLDDAGILYEKIKVTSEHGIYSDSAGTSILNNGYHYGIKVGDMIFDNMNLNGISCNSWLDDLGMGKFGGID